MWDKEEIYTEGDSYYEALIDAFNNATKSIDLEMYIYADGEIGNKISQGLIEAASRGIKVRVIIDGIGSAGWMNIYGYKFTSAGIDYLIYHKLPWEGWKAWSATTRKAETFLQSLFLINNRSHRKMIIIDGNCAFVGSRNIIDYHSESICGENAWKDISAKVCGEAVTDLIRAFDRIWYRRVDKLKRPTHSQFHFRDIVRLNIFRKERLFNYRKLCSSISKANKRVWITSSYFLPHGLIIRSLKLASRKGIDVKLILPAHSDIPFFPCVAAVFYKSLLKAGIDIYEYQKSVLHSKAIIIDDEVIVGSSNLNHRSLLHDLEVDLLLNSKESINTFTNCFNTYMSHSLRASLEESKNPSIMQQLIGRVALLFKYYL